MTGPTFEVGQVVEYEYLWAREAQTGQDHGRKDRPCAVIVSAVDKDGRKRLFLAPITHAPPLDPGCAIEIPPALKRRLGLDDDRSWIVVSELNATRPPAPEFRRTPDGRWTYGILPEPVFQRVFVAVRRQADAKTLTIIDRDA